MKEMDDEGIEVDSEEVKRKFLSSEKEKEIMYLRKNTLSRQKIKMHSGLY